MEQLNLSARMYYFILQFLTLNFNMFTCNVGHLACNIRFMVSQ